MSLSLWMILGFSGWTLLVLLAGVGVRRWTLIFRGEAALTSFPGDVPHGSTAYRRAVRAHANCLETLPIFAGVVLVAAVTDRGSRAMDFLAAVTVGARIFQTSVHMLFEETSKTVAVRFTFFLVQLIAIVSMGLLVATTAR